MVSPFQTTIPLLMRYKGIIYHLKRGANKTTPHIKNNFKQ